MGRHVAAMAYAILRLVNASVTLTTAAWRAAEHFCPEDCGSTSHGTATAHGSVPMSSRVDRARLLRAHVWYPRRHVA